MLSLNSVIKIELWYRRSLNDWSKRLIYCYILFFIFSVSFSLPCLAAINIFWIIYQFHFSFILFIFSSFFFFLIILFLFSFFLLMSSNSSLSYFFYSFYFSKQFSFFFLIIYFHNCSYFYVVINRLVL